MSEDTKEHVIPGTEEEHEGEKIEGYDFRGDFSFEEMMDSYSSTVFQDSRRRKTF